MVSRLSILSSFTVLFQHNAPYFAVSPTPCPHILSPHHTSAWCCPRVLVCGPWVSLLWSQITGAWWGVTQLREFHCYTGHWPLTVPGTPASGHRDTGLAWHGRSLPHWLLLTHWPGLHWLLDSRPREQISHTQERSSYFGIEIEGCCRQILKMSPQRKGRAPKDNRSRS